MTISTIYEVIKTHTFIKWEKRLNQTIRATIYARIERLELGLFGDTKVVSRGLYELRVHCGPGYRVYFMKHDKTIIILLCGGDKSTQKRDIMTAKKLAESYFD